MKSRTDLIVATLDLLTVTAAGQSPEAEDVETIDKIIDGKLAELNRRRIMWFGDNQEFEDEHIDPLAIIMANTVAPAYGQARNPVSQMTAENTLREMRNSSWTPADVIPSQYF